MKPIVKVPSPESIKYAKGLPPELREDDPHGWCCWVEITCPCCGYTEATTLDWYLNHPKNTATCGKDLKRIELKKRREAYEQGAEHIAEKRMIEAIHDLIAKKTIAQGKTYDGSKLMWYKDIWRLMLDIQMLGDDPYRFFEQIAKRLDITLIFSREKKAI